jgi:hypothetical protein
VAEGPNRERDARTSPAPRVTLRGVGRASTPIYCGARACAREKVAGARERGGAAHVCETESIPRRVAWVLAPGRLREHRHVWSEITRNPR